MIEEGMFDKSKNAKNTMMNYVIFDNDNQRDDLSFWLDYIGVQKYIEILDFCKNYFDTEKVEYSLLKSVAIYDSKLSDELYSILRLFENRIKAIISNIYGDIKIKRNNYLSVINECCSNNANKVNRTDLVYPYYRLSKNSTIYNLLKESSIKGALSILTILDNELLTSIPSFILDNTKTICELRNIIFHHKIIVNQINEYKNTIVSMLQTLPNSIRKKYVDNLNDCIKDNTTHEASIANRIAFYIDDNTNKIILDFEVSK